MPLDVIEVMRAAHQLALDHGSRAHLHADKLASAAHEKMLDEDEQFWRAVAATLAPRTAGVKRMLLETAIAPQLKVLGFRKKDQTWWRAHAETIGVINIQKNPYGSGMYINLGVYVRQLGQEERPPEHRCHVRARLEQVASERFWNEIVSAAALAPPSAALIDAILHDGVGWLEQLATLAGLGQYLDAGGAHADLAVKNLFN